MIDLKAFFKSLLNTVLGWRGKKLKKLRKIGRTDGQAGVKIGVRFFFHSIFICSFLFPFGL